MHGEEPTISVLMSVYNGDEYLIESIESIINQTYTNFEFIIINDCSTDNTEPIIAQYAQQDKRIKLFNNQENIGLTKSLNKGLNLARGKYIARQDADDISLPRRLEKQLLVLERSSNVVLVSCNLEIINAAGTTINKEKRACKPFLLSWYLIFYNHIGGHSQVIFRKDKAIALGGYSPDFKYSQDYEFWCRLIDVGDILILPETLLKKREHEHTITATKRSKQLEYAFTVSQQNIKKLIAKELTIEEVSVLKKFWTGQKWNNFPDPKEIEFINRIQQEIFSVFIEQTHILDSKKDNIKKQLLKIIGRQFIYWVSSLSLIRCLLPRIKVSHYAFAWDRVGTIIFLLQEIIIQPVLILRHLAGRIYRLVQHKMRLKIRR